MAPVIGKYLQHLSVEELANTITHGTGLILSILGSAALMALAAMHTDPIAVAGLAIYGISLIVLYAASTIYHSTSSPTMKRRMRLADHCGIYLLIAGSYTPFGLIVLKGPLGERLLIALWSLAAIGIAAKLLLRHRFPAISVLSYLVMGWIGILAIQPLIEALGVRAVALIIAGGAAYSFGVVFFAWRGFRHHHAIFHVFVLAGSILHYIAIVLYVVPKV